jgi:pumilio family protein 6
LTAARKATKPHADDIANAKKLWEKLRRKSHVQKDERQQLVAELFAILTGRFHDFVFKHDSVRVVQCAVKYSTIVQKKEIANELKGSFKSLAENRYSKFLVAKMIVEGDQETKDLIIPEFYGHVRRLINHSEASWILDDIYRTVATKEQKAMLLKEWYGPEFALFKSDKKGKQSADLSSILKEHPEKKQTILKYLQGQINALVQKKLTGFTMLHDAMLQYMRNIDPESEDFTGFQRLIIGDKKEEETDLLQNLAFTNSGSEIVSLLLAYSSAKDRRQILKSYKDVMEMLAFDKFGYRVLISALDTLDDTRELLTRIYSELILLKDASTPEAQAEKVVALASSQFGHIALLYPFIGAKGNLLPQDSLQILQKVQTIRLNTSKKDPQVRREELLTPLSPVFVQTTQSNAKQLAATSYGCLFISEVLLDGIGDKEEALKSVASLVAGDPQDAAHITHSPFAGKMLKSLISGGRFDRASKKVILVEPRLQFAELVLPSLEEDSVFEKWLLSEGAFLVLQLLEAPWQNAKDGELVKKRVKANASKLKSAAKKDDTRTAKAAKLLLESIA